MKRTILLTLLFVAFSSAIQAQHVRKTYSVPRHYSEIQAIGAFNVVYSDKYDKLTLVAPKQLEPYIKVELFKDEPTLRIRYTNKNKVELKGESASVFPVLYVPVSEPISKLTVEGYSSFRSERPIEVSRFEIDADGAAMVDCGFNMPDGMLLVDADGAVMLTLQGEVGTLDLDLDGATALLSKANGKEYALRVRSAFCDMDGVSNAKFHCVDYLEAECDGVCKLQYTGTPDTRTSTSGLSVVKRTGNP